jgi:hypothetical protein
VVEGAVEPVEVSANMMVGAHDILHLSKQGKRKNRRVRWLLPMIRLLPKQVRFYK